MTQYREYLLIILKAFKQRQQKELRKENDRLVKQAVLDFTKPVYTLAVLSYVLSKIISKPRFLSKDLLPRMREIEHRIEDAIQSIDRVGEEQQLPMLQAIEKAIEPGSRSKFMSSLSSVHTKDL